MEPGARLRLHTGPHNARLALHLGLVVPDGTGITVANVTRHWLKGRVLAFDDSFAHEAWNNGSQSRIVLYMTVWHPDLQIARGRAGKGSSTPKSSEL